MNEVVGVAGPYCSGKSSAAGILVRNGFEEIDVDALGHAAREALADEVREEFGTLDRTELAGIVFSSAEALSRLESILHPWMIEKVRQRLRSASESNRKVVINAALLFPMGLYRFCDRVFWINAPLFVRFLRACRRDGISWSKFLQRVRSQSKLYPQILEEDVDIITIRNVGSHRLLEKRLLKRIAHS